MNVSHHDQPIADAFRRFAQERGWPKHKIDTAFQFAANALARTRIDASSLSKDWIIFARDRGFSDAEIADALGFVDAGSEIAARVGPRGMADVMAETFPAPPVTDQGQRRLEEIRQLMASDINAYWSAPALQQEYRELLESTAALPSPSGDSNAQ